MAEVKEQKWDVLSPDGFSINREEIYYPSKDAAIKAFNEWKKRYEHQGYYSYNEQRIPLENLFNECQFISVN